MKGKFKSLLVVLTTILTLSGCQANDTNLGTGVYPITFIGNDYVSASGLPESADSGDTIDFTLNVSSGYELSRIFISYKDVQLIESSPATDLEEAEYEQVVTNIEVSVNGDLSSGYSFTMPEGDVTILAEAVGSSHNLSYTNSTVLTDYNNQTLTTGDFVHGIYEPYTGAEIGLGLSNQIQTGRFLLVVGERPSSTTNVKLYANGEELEQITDSYYDANYFAFNLIMPDEDVTLSASADLLYTTVSLDLSNISFEDGSGDEILNAYLYTQEDSNTRTQSLETQKVGADIPYVHAEVNTAYVNDYSLDSMTISWSSYQSNYSSIVVDGSKTTSWSDSVRLPNNANRIATDGTAYYTDRNTKTFQIPSVSYVNPEIVITFNLKDLQPYRGASFLGTWKGFEYNQISSTTGNDDVTITMLEDGAIVSMVEDIGNSTIIDIGENGTDLILDDGRTFYSDGIVGVTPIFLSGGSTSTRYAWIFAKGDTLPTIKFWEDSDEDHAVWVAQVLVNDQVVSAICASPYLEPNFYVGVTIEFSSGTYVSDSSARFTVKDSDGNTLLNVNR